MVLKRSGITKSVYRTNRGKRERAFQVLNLPPILPRAVVICNIPLSFPQFSKLLPRERFTSFWCWGRKKTVTYLVHLHFLCTHPSPSFSKTSNTSSGCLVKLSSSNFFSCLWTKKFKHKIHFTCQQLEYKMHYLFYNQHLRDFFTKSSLVNDHKGKLRDL